MKNWLKEKRLKSKLTQAMVAKRAGISRAFYTEIETGKKSPSPATAMQIAKVIGFEWVIFFDNNCSVKQQKDLLENQAV